MLNTILLAVCIVLLVVTIGLQLRKKENGSVEEKLNALQNTVQNGNNSLTQTIVSQVSAVSDSVRNESNNQRKENREMMDAFRGEVSVMRKETTETLQHIQASNMEAMRDMRNQNQESLDKINDTVNEKLQKTLDDRISQSFELVNQRLAEVYQGLGEMRNLASGVSDLKNVLSNVKTRGIIGEYQLEAILDEILTRDQFEVQFQLVPGSVERVDFAIKLPGTGDDAVYLPIDSKFPGDTYSALVSALESGSREDIDLARKQLRSTILSEAKSIHDKYIEPPYTTDFAIMFLPFEGLYAEVVNMGLLEEMQRKYSINIAGPSTMAAMLNSFQMGFRTLAIQKRSGEVWKVLEAVKKEFGTFEQGLGKLKERLTQSETELDKLIGTRTNAINRKLKEVSNTATFEEARETLGIPTDEE